MSGALCGCCAQCTGFDVRKCSKMTASAYFLGVATFVMFIVALMEVGWCIFAVWQADSNGRLKPDAPQVGVLTFGLLRYEFDVWATGTTFTGSIDDFDSVGILHGDVLHDLEPAGKKVWGVTVPGMACLLMSYVCLGIFRFNRTPVSFWWALVGVCAHLTALTLFVAGVLLYDEAVLVGSSYLLFLGAGLIVGFVVLVQFYDQLVSRHYADTARPRLRTIVSAVLLLASTVLAIAGLATLNWMVLPFTGSDNKDYHLFVGLQQYKAVRDYDGYVAQSGSVSDVPLDFTVYDGFVAAGRWCLALGIPGLFCSTVSTGFAIWAVTGKPSWYWRSWVMSIASSALLLAGAFLYGRTIFMGWAFSLYTVTPFVSLVSLVLLVLVMLDDDSRAAPMEGAVAAQRQANERAKNLNSEMREMNSPNGGAAAYAPLVSPTSSQPPPPPPPSNPFIEQPSAAGGSVGAQQHFDTIIVNPASVASPFAP